MSKQTGSSIELALSSEETMERVMTAVTDPARRYRQDPGHPEVCNVYSLHGYFSPSRLDDIAKQCRSAQIGCVDCKMLLGQGMNTVLEPLRQRRADLATQPQYVTDVLADGAQRASIIAKETIREVKQNMGLL